MLSYFSGLFVWHRLPALLHQLLNQISIEEKYLDEGKNPLYMADHDVIET